MTPAIIVLSVVVGAIARGIPRSGSVQTPPTFFRCRFTSLRRKHHCRQCGNLACSRCAPDEKPARDSGERSGRRCNDCVTCTSAVSWKGKTLELNLASRSLTSIPRFAWQLLSLQSCVLSMNRLRSLPMDAVVWSCLKRLDLQCNVLAKLPAELFADMPCLEHLDLSNNQVSRTARYPARLYAAPQSMQRSTLTLGFDAIRMRHLTNARAETLCPVQLDELPPSLGALLRLEHLDAADNCLTALPVSRRQLRHICAGTGLTPATSAPRLGSPRPHLRRD